MDAYPPISTAYAMLLQRPSSLFTAACERNKYRMDDGTKYKLARSRKKEARSIFLPLFLLN
jgi:hypothetical protein